MQWRDLLQPLGLFVAFIATLAVYTILRMDGIEGGPVDELLLVLGGGIAGATVATRT